MDPRRFGSGEALEADGIPSAVEKDLLRAELLGIGESETGRSLGEV